MHILRLSLFALLVTTFYGAASATNILINPGFETGDFTGWTVSGNSPNVGVATQGTPIAGTTLPSAVHIRSGDDAAFATICCTGLPGFQQTITLSQTVPVLPGENDSVGFYLGSWATGYTLDVNDNETQIFIDGAGILTGPSFLTPAAGHTPADFTLLSGTFNTGSRTSVTVEFQVSGSGAFEGEYSMDDFFLNTAASRVPEPTSLFLLATGLALLFAKARASARHRHR
jgi:hypothetical protein